MAIIMAAPRDASWYSRPNTAGLKKMHVVGADGRSACGRSILQDDEWEPAASVDPVFRCKKPGCRERWRPAIPTGAPEGGA